VATKVREILAVSKETAQKFEVKKFNLNKSSALWARK
jgi:hypothetical protein